MFETKCDKIYSRCKIVAKYILAKKKEFDAKFAKIYFCFKIVAKYIFAEKV